MMRLCGTFCLLLLLTACPGDDGPELESSSDTSTSPGTPGPIAGCECIVDEEPVSDSSPPIGPTCGDSLCPNVIARCVGGSCSLDGTFALGNPHALDCALVALRDRTPGVVDWWFDEGDGFSERGYVLVEADGTAVRRQWNAADLSFEVSDAVLGPLPSADIFDACLMEPDDRARFDCMRAKLEQPIGVCDEGWWCPECLF